jgi:hypothetical protein
MSIIFDIRNLKNPQDLQNKRADFFKTLRLQAKLNKDYEDSMIARQQIQKLGIAPMVDIPQNAEAERTEVMLQYDMAIKHLTTIMNEAQAVNAVGRLTDEEVFQVNAKWTQIQPTLMTKRAIMSGQFFVMYFRRYMDYLQREGGDQGVEIPLLDTTIHQLPQDVRSLWMEFSKGNIDSQTGKPWELETLIAITANTLARTVQDVGSEIQNRMANLSRYAPARVAATRFFNPKPSADGKKAERGTETFRAKDIMGTNSSETFATTAQVQAADAENMEVSGLRRGRITDRARFAARTGMVGPSVLGTRLVGQAEQMNNELQTQRQRTQGRFRRVISPIPNVIPLDDPIIIDAPPPPFPVRRGQITDRARFAARTGMVGPSVLDKRAAEDEETMTKKAKSNAARQGRITDKGRFAARTGMVGPSVLDKRAAEDDDTMTKRSRVQDFRALGRRPRQDTAEPAFQPRQKYQKTGLTVDQQRRADTAQAERAAVVAAERSRNIRMARAAAARPTLTIAQAREEQARRIRNDIRTRRARFGVGDFEMGAAPPPAPAAPRRAPRARRARAPAVPVRNRPMVVAAMAAEKQRIADAIMERTGLPPKGGNGMEEDGLDVIAGEGVNGTYGARGLILHPRPGRGIKIGRGLPPNEERPYTKHVRHAQFGKYIIHLPSLDKMTVNIKYPSALNIADIPNRQVSGKFVKMIYNMLETDMLDKGMFNALDEDEQSFFYYLARRCDVDIGMTGNGMMTEKDKKDMERFELVRGQVIAGNNSPELLKELKQYLLKFLAEKRITRAIGNQILYEIAILS